MSDSIIIYRNPAEQAFWEGGFLIPIVGGIGVGLVVFLVLVWIIGMFRFNVSKRVYNGLVNASGILALAAFLFTTHKMLI